MADTKDFVRTLRELDTDDAHLTQWGNGVRLTYQGKVSEQTRYVGAGTFERLRREGLIVQTPSCRAGVRRWELAAKWPPEETS